jgi:hypothetical protein
MDAAWPDSNLLFYKALADAVAGVYKNLTVRPIVAPTRAHYLRRTGPTAIRELRRSSQGGIELPCHLI